MAGQVLVHDSQFFCLNDFWLSLFVLPATFFDYSSETTGAFLSKPNRKINIMSSCASNHHISM
jgi:hypothetical protein